MQAMKVGAATLYHADMRDVLPTLSGVDSVVTDPPYLLEFMGKRWDVADASLGVSPFDAWFAGFCAGEACFRVQSHKEGRYYTCTFSVHMRADDAPVLIHLQKRIGGRIHFDDARENRQGISSAPAVRWVIDSKDDCRALASILDRAPMFAKKARDYRLWRRALHLWETTPPGSRWTGPRDVAEMAALHRELQAVKRYDADFDVKLDPFMPPAQAFHYEWARLAFAAMKPGAHLVAFSGPRTYHRMVCGIEDAGFEIRDQLMWVFGSGFPKSRNLRGDLEGWGTALKPAFEPIVLARKPLIGTVEENVLKYGTGALNIDACRVAVEGEVNPTIARRQGSINHLSNRSSVEAQAEGKLESRTSPETYRRERPGEAIGRWPANVLHDGSDEVLSFFPDAPGQIAASSSSDSRKTQNVYGAMDRGGHSCAPRNDTGSAARFFYCAKTSRSERGDYNTHPTVKPIALMRWLCTLVTPPGGNVLDPFGGSMSTGLAALDAGFTPILIEREREYFDIGYRRLLDATKQPRLFA